MHSLANTLLLVLGLVALVAASPTQHIQKRGVYKVERVRNPHFVSRNGPRALYKALTKYNMPVPGHLVTKIDNQNAELLSKRESLSKREPRRRKGMGRGGRGGNGGGAAGGAGAAAGGSAAQQGATNVNKNGTGIVAAIPQTNDVEYLSPVNIGGQVLNLDFDTGSSDLWVFNTQLSAAQSTGHNLFDPQSSNTFKLMNGAQFEISYGDGSGAAGNVGTDVVNLGGAEVQAQAVELAQQVTDSFVQDTSTDGLLGLAFSTINTVQPQAQNTFFDNVMDSLAEPLFTADLKHATAGTYEFGNIDAAKFTGDMTFVAIDNSNGFWQFTSDQFAVDGGKTQTSTAGAQAIADTGTTLLLTDPAVATAYYAQVQGAEDSQQEGGFVIPCDATLPDIQLAVGDSMATVKGTDLNFAPVDAAGTTCFGGIQGTTSDIQIYGDIFFKSNFVVFNGGNNTLGFAPHSSS